MAIFRNCERMTRRDSLRLGLGAIIGGGLVDALRLRGEAAIAGARARPTSCILIWMDGGPSHYETFDPKPGAPAEIRNARIETVIGGAAGADIVCARALASLDQLLDWSAPLLNSGTIGLFPKGRDVQAELTQAARRWTVTYDLVPSRTDADARIVRVTALTESSPR